VKRRLKALWKKLGLKVAPFFINYMQYFLALSCRKNYYFHETTPPVPTIWVCWHGQLLMAPILFRLMRKKPHRIYVIVSEHAHGDMAVKSFGRYGFNFIRGSSRQGAIKALRQAIEKLGEGYDIGITPDGPIGPLHSVSDGAYVLAQRCNAVVKAIGWTPSRYWQLGSWDGAKIPKPFSTINFRASESFSIAELDKEAAKKLIYEKLMWCCEDGSANF
jgi:lysophospholipid acyltransferase (LPLAT)-like uncharacterized protein